MMPDYRRDNPYQQLLADSLGRLGVEVVFPKGYRRILPLWREWKAQPGNCTLHLHWINPYLRGRNALSQAAYCVRLLLDVALIRASGQGVTWTIHNRVSHESSWPRLEKWVQRRLAYIVNRVIVHTRASLEELRKDLPLPDDKVSVIPHGHYREAYGAPIDATLARKKLDLPPVGRIYLCFGMLRPYKGIERLLQEWRKLEISGSQDTLLIAGKALQKEYLAHLEETASGCNGIVIRGAFVPPSQIPVFFSAADVVVLPFERILTSGSLLLAMSYGKSVIAPAFEGIVETLGNANDFLYDPADPGGLRVTIKRSSLSPLESSNKRTETVCNGLDWGGIATMTLGAYRRAMNYAN